MLFVKEQIIVQHVETPTQFYAQVIDERMEELANMSNTLNDVCPSSPKLTGSQQPNKVHYNCLKITSNQYK